MHSSCAYLHCTFSHRSTRFSFMGLRWGLHTAQSPGSISGSLVSEVSVQRRATPSPILIRNHLWHHLKGTRGLEAEFPLMSWLGSLTERVKEKTVTISAFDMKSAASGRQASHRYSVKEPGAGFQSWTTLIHSAACCLHARGIVDSLLESIPHSIFNNPEPAGEHFHFASATGCLAWGWATIK